MRIVCISDTHGRHPIVPSGDVLIHAGDLTEHGTADELIQVADWLYELPHEHKLIVAGNHDFALQRYAQARDLVPGIYLEDSGIEIEGVRFWGAPWQPYTYNGAFGIEEEDIATKWDVIPADIHVLITHIPPRGIRDRSARGQHIGCPALRDRLPALRQLRLHVFGHAHSSYGFQVSPDSGSIAVNAANVHDGGYIAVELEAVGLPVVIPC